MNFQKIYTCSPKVLSLFFGSMCLFLNLIVVYSWIFGAKFTQMILNSNGKDFPLAWDAFIFGYLSYTTINEFFYYRKKMMVGYNDAGLCVYNEPTSSYIFILWTDLNDSYTSFGFGGRYGFNPHGLITLDFKKATLCQVNNNSSYINNFGYCDLQIHNEEKLDEGNCAVDFGYWSWQPYTIKKEIKTRCTL
ncbi:MAG: hypothetical protein AB7F19_03940 [Candidatus Babeliales bacterium]